jgi:hypothetical protein
MFGIDIFLYIFINKKIIAKKLAHLQAVFSSLAKALDDKKLSNA